MLPHKRVTNEILHYMPNTGINHKEIFSNMTPMKFALASPCLVTGAALNQRIC